MLLYLIRHGESTYNAQGRIQGRSDCDLSDHGRRQAQAMARRMADAPIEAVYASPLRRATQTAEFLASALGLAIRFDPRLVEVDAGHFEEQMRDEVMRRFPGAIPQWRSGAIDFVFPGGESRRALIERGREAILSIVHAGHEHAAVVSHGGLLLAGMKSLLGIASEAEPLDMDNASITRLQIDPDGRFELVDFNNVEHLSAVRSP
jgi:2,3-bisphosphoglycerate-dependent phosphoglycerate mutase